MKSALNRASVYLFTCSIIAAIYIGCSAIATAETLQVEYKSFYSHVSKLRGEDTTALQFAFGFMNIRSKTLCSIESAHISTQKQQIPLIVSEENRFTVPTERALNLAKALVVIELKDPANICDMSVQLETKPEYLKTSYSKQDLDFLFDQYTAFFDKMGSFLSFLMPNVNGITVYFKDSNYSQGLDGGLSVEAGKLTLTERDLANVSMLNLPRKPLRITAEIEK